jgi:NMD protein affecting ribosome stability and mRNA decay
MVNSATETCCKCGKEIFVKEVSSYKVLPNYRLLCSDCAMKDGLIDARRPGTFSSGPAHKTSRAK